MNDDDTSTIFNIFRIPGSRHVVIDGASHNMIHQRPGNKNDIFCVFDLSFLFVGRDHLTKHQKNLNQKILTKIVNSNLT